MKTVVATCLLVWIAASATAHPGNGIVVLADGSVVTGDALHSKVWRFKPDGTKEQIVGDFHCHWVTKGLDGKVYADRIAEGQGWNILVNRLDLAAKSATKLLTLGPRDSGAFVVDAEGNVVAFTQGALRRLRPDGASALFCMDDPALDGVKAMCWGKDGELVLVQGDRLWSVKAGEAPVVKKTFTGRATVSLYAGEGQARQPWGVAVDPVGRILLADASRGRVVRLEKDGSETVLATSRDGWVATGVATKGDDVYLLESKTVGSTNAGPRVSVVDKARHVRVLGTVLK